MNNDQIDYMKDNNVIVKEAIWNVEVPKYKILGRDHLKTQVARAFLPDYFCDYNVYIWLDADLWLNDYETFKLYEQGALQDCIAITPQSDRAYFNNANVEWFMNFPKKVKLKSNSPFVGAELAIKAGMNGYKVGEIGIHTYPSTFGTGSSVSFKNIVLTLKDMLLLFIRI